MNGAQADIQIRLGYSRSCERVLVLFPLTPIKYEHLNLFASQSTIELKYVSIPCDILIFAYQAKSDIHVEHHILQRRTEV